MPGYFKNPEATASTLIDGWCHTGDIGYYNEVAISVHRVKEILYRLKDRLFSSHLRFYPDTLLEFSLGWNGVFSGQEERADQGQRAAGTELNMI